MGLKELLIDIARNPASANTFNYASMAHNNHFYFSTLVRLLDVSHDKGTWLLTFDFLLRHPLMIQYQCQAGLKES